MKYFGKDNSKLFFLSCTEYFPCLFCEMSTFHVYVVGYQQFMSVLQNVNNSCLLQDVNILCLCCWIATIHACVAECQQFISILHDICDLCLCSAIYACCRMSIIYICCIMSTIYVCVAGCQEDQFECNTGACVYIHERCDGKAHCSDASDELNCTDG